MKHLLIIFVFIVIAGCRSSKQDFSYDEMISLIDSSKYVIGVENRWYYATDFNISDGVVKANCATVDGFKNHVFVGNCIIKEREYLHGSIITKGTISNIFNPIGRNSK